MGEIEGKTGEEAIVASNFKHVTYFCLFISFLNNNGVLYYY